MKIIDSVKFYLQSNPACTAAECAAALGVNVKTVGVSLRDIRGTRKVRAANGVPVSPTVQGFTFDATAALRSQVKTLEASLGNAALQRDAAIKQADAARDAAVRAAEARFETMKQALPSQVERLSRQIAALEALDAPAVAAE